MNTEKPCQGKNSDSAKKFVRTPLTAIRGGPVLYTPKNALSRRPLLRRAHRSEGAPPQGGPRWRFGWFRLGKLPAPSTAPFPRYPLGACLGARTLCPYSIGWVLAPRLRPANVPQGPFPGLRSPFTVRQALHLQERVVFAGSAFVAPRCARPPFRLRLPFGAYVAGGSGVAAAGGGRSEVKRSRVGSSNGEPQTESPSEAAQPRATLR
jgi:hypothetical protein